jgi:hypothetical protein
MINLIKNETELIKSCKPNKENCEILSESHKNYKSGGLIQDKKICLIKHEKDV